MTYKMRISRNNIISCNSRIIHNFAVTQKYTNTLKNLKRVYEVDNRVFASMLTETSFRSPYLHFFVNWSCHTIFSRGETARTLKFLPNNIYVQLRHMHCAS